MLLGQVCAKTMKLQDLVKNVESLAIKGQCDEDIVGVTCDSRQVRPGWLFVAMQGQHLNGVDFIEDAIRRGAKAVVSENNDWMRRDVSHVRVKDAYKALAEIASTFYQSPSSLMQVVGITGTSGKTTTSFLTKEILRADGRAPGLVGTIRYEIGQREIPANRTTPLADELQAMLARMVKAGCRSAVMEVSSHSLIQKRVYGVDFDIGVFTNLSQDHLDYHQTMDEYFQAKELLFQMLGRDKKKAVAVINLDDPWGSRLAKMKNDRVQLITFGIDSKAMVRAEEVKLGSTQSSFVLRSPWGEASVRLPLMGRFNVSNALAAFAACGALGIDPRLMAETVGKINPVPGRLEIVPHDGGWQVFVDYAHKPDALEKVLITLREIATRRIILVFGCGGDRDKTKRPLMGAVATRLADEVIITNDNCRSEEPAAIAQAIYQGCGPKSSAKIILDRAEAIGCALGMARAGDVVLVAGKGHENYQEIGATTLPFDDREVVRSWLASSKNK